MSRKRITPPILRGIISYVDRYKANGCDETPTIVLTKCIPKLAPVRSKLYNKCLAVSVFKRAESLIL